MDKVDGEFNDYEVVDEKEFNNRKANIEKAKKYVNSREITNPKKTKELDYAKEIKSGYVLLKSNLDVQTEGVYEVETLTVDKNFNTTTKKWNVELFAKDIIINSGGKVTCDYNGAELADVQGMTVNAKQNFLYDEEMTIRQIEMIIDAKLLPEYIAPGNLDRLTANFNDAYTDDIKGITKSHTTNGYDQLNFAIFIDMEQYDRDKDELKLILGSKKATLDMAKTLKLSKLENLDCDARVREK